MKEKLAQYDAQNIKDHLQQSGKVEKIRYMFEINERKQALACFNFFSDHNKKKRQGADQNEGFELQEQIRIYLQKEDHIFEKYANQYAASIASKF